MGLGHQKIFGKSSFHPTKKKGHFGENRVKIGGICANIGHNESVLPQMGTVWVYIGGNSTKMT